MQQCPSCGGYFRRLLTHMSATNCEFPSGNNISSLPVEEVIVESATANPSSHAVSRFGRRIITPSTNDNNSSGLHAFGDLSELNTDDDPQSHAFPLWNNDDSVSMPGSVIGDIPLADSQEIMRGTNPESTTSPSEVPDHPDANIPLLYPTTSQKYDFTFTPDDRAMMRLYDYCQFAGCPRYFLDGLLNLH